MKSRNQWFRKQKRRRDEAQAEKRHNSPQKSRAGRRLPRIGDMPAPYEIPDIVLELYDHIGELAEEVLDGLDADEKNEGFLDQYIETVCRIGVADDLAEQRWSHKQYCISNQEKFEYQRKKLQDYHDFCLREYEKNREELEALQRREEDGEDEDDRRRKGTEAGTKIIDMTGGESWEYAISREEIDTE